MFTWPNLELTDYERKFVRIYKTKDKPGVLKRVYKARLNDTADPDRNLPRIQLSDQIQISRRSRIFGLCFSGDVGSWRLQVTNASGTTYTVKTPRTQQDPVVSSLFPGTNFNALSLGGLVPPITLGTDQSPSIGPNYLGQVNSALLGGLQSFPLIVEPNWVLLPNETLIFNGTPLPVEVELGKDQEFPPLILEIAIHVWEFPGMGTAPAKLREVV